MTPDGWRERFSISISYYMPVPKQYWNWRIPKRWPTALEGKLLNFSTFDEAVAERRWRLNNFDKWLPPDGTHPEVSDVLRTVWTLNVNTYGPPPAERKALNR